MKVDITPEVIEALRVLRAGLPFDSELNEAIDTLDNAGIFHLIDEATGYDVDPEPTRLLKGGTARRIDKAATRRKCPQPNCYGTYAVNKDGSLRKHTNDNFRTCKGEGK